MSKYMTGTFNLDQQHLILWKKSIVMSSISVDLEKEDILLQVRDKLRQDNVNLWLQPFYHEASATSSQEDMLVSLFRIEDY